MYRAHPALQKQESRDSFARFPVLHHTEAGRCVFLDDDDACSVYPIRPLVCRRFPYLVEDDGKHVAWSSLCSPHRSDVDEFAKTLAAVAENYNAKLRDLEQLRFDRSMLRDLGIEQYLPRTFDEILDETGTQDETTQ